MLSPNVQSMLDTHSPNRSFSLDQDPTTVQQQHTQRAATQAAMVASMEAALKGEVRRLKDENSTLRREAQRCRALQQEVDTLRAVTLLQSEEKVPIRLRELELENLRLKRVNRSLEERVSTLESDEHRQWLADQHRFYATTSREKETAPAQEAVESSPGGSAPSVRVLKGGQTCDNCNLKLSTLKRAHLVEMDTLKKDKAALQEQLRTAQAEIQGIQAWIAPLLADVLRYPHVAANQNFAELHSFASPTRYTTDVQNSGVQLLGNSSSMHYPMPPRR